jgi:hypothetical protein
MKKLLRIIYTSLFIVCCGCFLLACIDPIVPPAPQEITGGEGNFCLVTESETESRTILPATVKNNFQAYTLVFSSIGRDNVSVDRTNSNLASSVTLPAATWNLTVTAYMDSARTKPAAQESLTNIVITAGANVSHSLELKPIIENGATGTFSWNISYPSDVTLAGMKITPLNTATGTPEQTLYFIGGTPLVNKNNKSSPLNLNTGYYKVVFSLSNGEHSTGREEYLHVYKNMDSLFEFTFTQAHFTFYSVTNGNDLGPGSLRHAITNAASGNTILIESDVGNILLTSRLSINKSLTIAGNGVTITKDPSWTTDDDDSQLLVISGSSTTVTINRVFFKNGNASYGSAILIQSGSVNLESCIFNGNQSTTNKMGYGAVYNNGTLNLRGNTFHNNRSNYGGAVYNTGTLILTGNMFYGNTAASGPVVRNASYGTASSAGYNVVDVLLGTTVIQSGWTGQSTDKAVSSTPIAPATFKILSGRDAQNVIPARPSGYPTVDFYGNSIPASNAAAGAVQAAASGYFVDLSVNNSGMGSAAITSAPTLNADGLYPSGSVTLTATAASTGPAGYGFQYWLVNNIKNTVNPLLLTLTSHYKVQAIFGKNSIDSVRWVEFSGPTETVTLNGLNNNDIYLVKVNVSQNIVSAANTGGPPGSSSSPSPNLQSDWFAPENELPRMGHEAADEFNANPPPIVDAGPRRSRAVFVPPKVGDPRMFWVESYYNSGTWVQKQATLRATGKYGNVWVMDEDYGSGSNKINDARAKELSDKFDLIYPVETNLLGFEYGGGPGGDGGKDGDPKIQILIYSILNAQGDGAGVGGFFWSKDFYENWNGSNLGEIFYVNTSTAYSNPDFTYSALIHEFQHMINYNMKYLRLRKSSETWYDEMLSMAAEDVIGPLIGLPPTNRYHATQQRMPTFLYSYNQVGVTEWNSLGSSSYAKGYAFGAYLMRNYGGASLLQEMLANDSTNIESITAALDKVAGKGLTFEEALRRYGEALVFSGTMPADVQSFDKTVSKTIGGTTYTATKFDVWTDFLNISSWSGANKPNIFDANKQLEMRPYSLTVHQGADSTWKNVTGSATITLQRPDDPNVELYLMVK